MTTERFPYVSRELIEELERRFPERSPIKGETMEALLWRGGECSVVRFLREKFKSQSPLENLNVQSSEG